MTLFGSRPDTYIVIRLRFLEIDKRDLQSHGHSSRILEVKTGDAAAHRYGAVSVAMRFSSRRVLNRGIQTQCAGAVKKRVIFILLLLTPASRRPARDRTTKLMQTSRRTDIFEVDNVGGRDVCLLRVFNLIFFIKW